jgi:hypothetical protein
MASKRRPGRQEANAEAARILRGLLEAIGRGELDASPTMLAYLSGALAALESSSRSSSDSEERLRVSPLVWEPGRA